MIRSTSLFSQLISVFNRYEVYRLIRQHQAERYAKGYSSWDHCVAMLFCQLAQAKSLREICGGLACCLGKVKHLGMKAAPNKSTLSYANAHRPWQLFQALFYATLATCRSAGPHKHHFRFKNKLLSLDSSTISLCLSLFPWAQFRRAKGAIKLHLLLDHEGYLPAYACISDGKKHDVTVARSLALAAGSIVTMDKAYTDYKLFAAWTNNGVYFVTRLKENADYTVVQQRTTPLQRNIFADELIRFTGYYAQRDCPHVLRRVVVWDPENKRNIILLTNHLLFGSSTIAAIYKDRWQIELFFKALKQNLKVKTFVGTSPNALYIQIWTALIAILLIKYLQFRSTFGWSLSNLVAFLRWNLFTYRDLWQWINAPYSVMPLGPGSGPYQPTLPGFGQHL